MLIKVAYIFAGKPVTAGRLQAAGAMTALLKGAIKPNLIQTLENTPAFKSFGDHAGSGRSRTDDDRYADE